MSTEGLMLSCMIDATEDRYIATANIPGAFLQTDYYKGDINIKMEGAMVTLLEEIDPSYYKGYIYINIHIKIHIYIIQLYYIRHYIGITALPKKNSKSLEEMGYQRSKYYCFL